MPQMAPISWISLFIIFFIALFIFNLINFYCFYAEQSLNKESNKMMFFKNHHILNWMW